MSSSPFETSAPGPSRPLPSPFPRAEFARRAERARALMDEARLDALFVCTEVNFRYLTGFASQFWVSPTRPWYFLLPRDGEAVAVIPTIGEANFRATSWVEDLRSWPSPRPEDEGVSLLAEAMRGLRRDHGRIGAEFGREMHLRMPVLDLFRLRDAVRPLELVDGSDLLRALRMTKSPAEVERIRFVAETVCDGFDALPGWAACGMSEREICQRLQADLILRGVDKTPYLIGRSGPGGYESIIMGPTERQLGPGDLLIIDTGCTYDGYFCDFDRNFAFAGPPDEAARRAQEAVWQATEAGIAAARPGRRMCDVWEAMFAVIDRAGGLNAGVGRMGHGLGMNLTEPPSVMPGDETPLSPGMVITIEPGMMFAPGKLMVHEENVVITKEGCELLTRRAPAKVPIVTG